MSTKEIVTLQFGHYSNFIGTHWWNIQESSFVYPGSVPDNHEKEVDADILFREGKTLKGDITYTPRLIIVDLKGSLNTLKKKGTLYDTASEDEVKWPGDVTLHETPRVAGNEFLEDLRKEQGDYSIDPDIDDFPQKEKITTSDTTCPGSEDTIFGSRYYDLDDLVKVWSDFLRIHLHPNSVNVVKEYSHDNDWEPFDVFGQGSSVMVPNSSFLEEWEHSLHFFTEECDHLQGFHILMDQHNGFGGMAWQALSLLNDDFHNKARLTFASTPASCPDSTPAHRACRILSSALCIEQCSSLSSLYVPLSLASSLWRNMGPPRGAPGLQYKAGLPYHTSAILAASLDTVTMSYRRDGILGNMADLTSSLSGYGKKVAALATSLPFPLTSTGNFADALMEHGEEVPLFSVTPHTTCVTAPYVQFVTVRGVPASRVKSLSAFNLPRQLASANTVDKVLHIYMADMFPNTHSMLHVFHKPCKVIAPFPHIFRKHICQAGFLTQTERPPSQGVNNIPMMTSLQSTPDVASLLSSIHEASAKFNIRLHPRFLEHGLEEDEFREVINNLQVLTESYTTVF